MTLTAQLQAWLDRPTTAEEEDHIIQALVSATSAELNAALDVIGADRILSSVDNRILGPDNQSRLITLLTVDRLADLSLTAKADVVYAMQSGWTTVEMERAIRGMFLAMHGLDLTRFKNQLNMRTDQHDLEGLLFQDIHDEPIREQILAHFALEAPNVGRREAKVLSDIDDTCVARIHDDRYPKGTLYPGVLAMYEALDKGPEAEPLSTGDLTFVTARPGDAFGLIENHSRDALRKAGISQMSMLTGGFTNLVSKKDMAEKKLENISHYCLLFPEYDMVFLGDSGQGDVLTGEGMFAAHPDVAKAVFIHDVVDTPAAQRQFYAEKGIHFHDTYVGAAVGAHELGLISHDGLTRVVSEATRQMDQIQWASTEQESAMRALLARDIALAG